ncbi:MAG: TrmB family transcriptional regulator [archaeon]|nr:MAG: TrmB family transcriptional regulator [archaeon]
MNKQDLIKKIKYHFALNIYESKVWLALLSRNIASVGEVAEMSGVPRSRVYDVLESLEKQGFAIAKLGKPVKYIAVKPTTVLERLKNKMLKEAETRVKNLGNVKTSREFKEIENLYTNGIQPIQPEDLSSAVKGRANIYNHVKELVGNAKKEVVLVSSPTELKRKAHFLKPLFEKLRGNKVKIFVASSIGEKGETTALPRLLGVPVRKTRANGRFCIVDSERSLVTITPENEEGDIAILLNSPFFSKAINSFLVPTLRTN